VKVKWRQQKFSVPEMYLYTSQQHGFKRGRRTGVRLEPGGVNFCWSSTAHLFLVLAFSKAHRTENTQECNNCSIQLPICTVAKAVRAMCFPTRPQTVFSILSYDPSGPAGAPIHATLVVYLSVFENRLKDFHGILYYNLSIDPNFSENRTEVINILREDLRTFLPASRAQQDSNALHIYQSETSVETKVLEINRKYFMSRTHFRNLAVFEITKETRMKSSIWDITPCNPLKFNRCFGGTCYTRSSS
jgi:hypothetical protein